MLVLKINTINAFCKLLLIFDFKITTNEKINKT